MKKIVFIISLVIIMLLSIYNITYAASLDNVMSGADSFIQAGKDADVGIGIDMGGITSASDMIYNALLTIGIIIAVLVAAFLGIKIVTGSVEEKANVKETLVPFLIGCVVIFGAFGIWRLVTNLLETL